VVLDHYFRTAEPDEAIAIDQGAAGPGWVRTGDDFRARPRGVGAGADVCRFYNPVANTHFFTAENDECLQVRQPQSGWRFEGLAFRARTPAAGRCSLDYFPVYRNYNGRFAQQDSNHRFTTHLATYQEMIARGWQGEGVAMCVLEHNAEPDAAKQRTVALTR
jgi:hypothetical protein